jgi:queuine tRNA-ribosyltransferase
MHKGNQRLYGIVQGGVHEDLRKQSAAFVTDNPFFGNAVGGSLGATKEQMYDVVSITMENLDRTRPTHLLGIGGIRDIFEGVKHGIDTFDCVHPTRLARHGGALVRAQHWSDAGRDAGGHEHINLRNAHFREDQDPIDTTCGCTTCASFSRGYLHHLLKAKELLALSAITIHNVFFMNRLMEAVRSAIRTNTLDAERKHWLAD